MQKQTDPDGHPQSFDFVAGYDEEGFSLSDGQQNDSGDLLPGPYSGEEDVPSGWILTSATCSDGSDPSEIELSGGETVTCVFRNTFVPHPARGAIDVPRGLGWGPPRGRRIPRSPAPARRPRRRSGA